MRTMETTVYKFSELSEEAKEKAIAKWYENEDYPFLHDDLSEEVKTLLNDAGVKHSDINVMYSLSWSQGDGLCFTGTIEKNGIELVLSHSWRYYYASSVNMDFYKDGEEVEENEETEQLKSIYFNACITAEKTGYSILEYRMNNNEFSEHCEANEYEFDEYGNMI